ncbi:hypothetical protein [Streptomyces demainii]|uniref:Carbon storage regulator n=1 Tax=Streptomyces demainii TaxID=588122 RepID=A0ABT9KSY8_9ACTN|nr:hypothetical protein [Streptomyces demainii]MDP9611532.1 hypothetical protein [Streptomyces demainii]
MALTLTIGRGQVRVDTGDDVTVTLKPTDDEPTLVRKFRRIINLAGGESAAVSPESASPAAPAAPVGNGWAAMAPPELPDRLKGEVEMIEPEA